MIFTVPVFVQERPAAAGEAPSFVVRPLFHAQPLHRADKLQRALNKLSAELHQQFYELGRLPRHDALAEWTFYPIMEEQTLDLRLELDSGSTRLRFFLAGYSALERKLFFTPPIPDLHFEVFPNQDLAERASAVFTEHFRRAERRGEPVDLNEFALSHKHRVLTVEITLKPAALAKPPPKEKRAFLFGSDEKMDGYQELRKTGRLLNQLYPDDLDRAIGRDREVEELGRLLASTDRRPILLVGPRKVGKTAIVHEVVYQIRSRKDERFAGRRDIWLLSPMRLISGMSHLGEWENRILAILDHAAGLDRVLYFDDLLGLLTAGKTCASDLNIAQVLKPAMEKRKVRVIAEITPEAWRLLRERDRALADLFHVIPINEPPEPETIRVLINLARQLEEQHHSRFSIEVVPLVLELHRRFAGDAAFPGKAAAFLRRLGVRFSGQTIGRAQVLYEFKEQNGLQLAFLDGQLALSRETISQTLQKKVVGQDHALDALADVLLILKAGLNDPRRPLGAMLLLGPTGVGKTQTAKALAEYLFGSSDRLLRFDLNEFVENSSTQRLVGTLDEPEGLLTNAIRRQPFSVVLFDEIEKAAPEVFDLLLGLLDEGRLADSLGRVADFTNAIVLMTSNLGVRESNSRLGFGSVERNPAAEDQAFVSAAEKFFRPEFFNRIDRIIPFRALEPKDLERIARQLVQDLLTRDGLRRRECFFNISAAALGRIIELGYHPHLGARVLKRVLENEIAAPMALHLSASTPGTPVIANFDFADNRFTLQVQDLKPAAQSIVWHSKLAQLSGGETRQLLGKARAGLERIDRDLRSHVPNTGGAINLAHISPQQAWFFACQEQRKKVERVLDAALHAGASTRGASAARGPRAQPRKVIVRQYVSGNPKYGRLRDAESLQVELAEWEAAESVEVPDSAGTAALRELALLNALACHPPDTQPLLLIMHGFTASHAPMVFGLAHHFHAFFAQLWGSDAEFILPQIDPDEVAIQGIFGQSPQPTQAIFIKGFNVRHLLPVDNSLVFVRHKTGSLTFLLLRVLPLNSRKEADTVLQQFLAGIQVSGLSQQMGLGQVIYLLHEEKSLTDFRTGMILHAKPAGDEFRAWMLGALPLPTELES